VASVSGRDKHGSRTGNWFGEDMRKCPDCLTQKAGKLVNVRLAMAHDRSLTFSMKLDSDDLCNSARVCLLRPRLARNDKGRNFLS